VKLILTVSKAKSNDSPLMLLRHTWSSILKSASLLPHLPQALTASMLLRRQATCSQEAVIGGNDKIPILVGESSLQTQSK
jgi:hypothetical protein